MKIVAPASSLEDIEELDSMGADEIYLGLRQDMARNDWDIINKRAEENANFMDYETLKKIRDLNINALLSLTINASFLTDQQMAAVKDQVLMTKDIVDNYIISDPSLIPLITKHAPGKKLIMSVIGACLNSSTAEFYRKQGISRIILPRHLNMHEFEKITGNNPDIEFEVLIMNQYCRNIDGFCSRCHIPLEKKRLMNCDIHFNSKIISLRKGADEKEKTIVHNNIKSIIHKHYKICGLCFIKKFRDIGIGSVKIVGRNMSHEDKKKDLAMVKKAVGMLDEPDYEEKCRELFEKRYRYRCKNNCYY